MKVLKTTMLSLVAIGMLSMPAMAQITGTLRADIPFPFTVVDTELPPGTYTIQVADGINANALEIASVDRRTKVMFLAGEADLSQPARKSELEFHQYGNREFLSQIFQQGTTVGSEVDMGHAELKLVKSKQAKRTVHRFPADKS